MIIMKQDGRTLLDTASRLVFSVTALPRQYRVDCYGVDNGSVFILGIYDTEDAAVAALQGIFENFPGSDGYAIMPPREWRPEGGA